MHDLISVIIPAYNVELYLERCIQSVLQQTYPYLEVILIDDGSTDKTGLICDSLAKLDGRVRVIHQSNGGLSVARNTGIDRATGDWIAFLDSDDWIDPEMYEELLNLAKEHDADIASCNTRQAYQDGGFSQKPDIGDVLVLETDRIIAGLRSQDVVRFEVWNKLWRRELIGDVRFKKGQVCEDIYFDRTLFLKANKMVHVNKAMHNYLVARPGNTNSAFRPAKMEGVKELHAFVDVLSKAGKQDLASGISAYASEFVITLYLSAMGAKAERCFKDNLKKEYRFFRKMAWGSGYENKKALILFSLSPLLYQRILQLKEQNIRNKVD